MSSRPRTGRRARNNTPVVTTARRVKRASGSPTGLSAIAQRLHQSLHSGKRGRLYCVRFRRAEQQAAVGGYAGRTVGVDGLELLGQDGERAVTGSPEGSAANSSANAPGPSGV